MNTATKRRMPKTIREAMAAREAGDRNVLFWSQQGAIECGEHIPYPGSDTWIWDRWRRMTDAERQVFHTEVGRPARCESCR